MLFQPAAEFLAKRFVFCAKLKIHSRVPFPPVGLAK
jgi:hypothetical protein